MAKFTVSIVFGLYLFNLILLFTANRPMAEADDSYHPVTGDLRTTPKPKTLSRPIGLQDLSTPKYLALNEEYSRNFSVAKTQLDASLLLSMKLLQHKMETLNNLPRSVMSSQIEQFVISDIKNESNRIANLQRAYFNLTESNGVLNNFCQFIEKYLRRTVFLSVNLIQLKQAVNILEKDNQLGKRLKEQVELYLDNQYSIYQSFYELYTYSYNTYNTEEDCGFTEYAKVLNTFITFLFKADFSNEIDGIMKTYNKFILKLAVDMFPVKSHKIVKRYSEIRIKDDNFLIDFVNEYCSRTCSRFTVLNLFVLVDRFPVDNGSVLAVNRLVRLYNSVASTDPFIEGSGDLLLIDMTVEKQRTDPAFESLTENLRDDFVESEKIISDRLEFFKRSLAQRIFSPDVSQSDKLLRNISRVNVHAGIGNPYYDLLYERFIKLLHDVFPNRVNEICLFIQDSSSFRMTMYAKLLDILMQGNDSITNDIFRVAHHIKTELDEKSATVLKNKLPRQIRNLIWNGTCKIKHAVYNEYLFPTELYFTNIEGSNLKKDYHTSVLAGGFKNNDPSLVKFDWHIEYNQLNNTFTITENNRRSYLVVRKSEGNRKSHLQFQAKSSENNETQWKMRIVKMDKDRPNSLTFQLLSSENPPEYLYASRNELDETSRNVFISDSEKNQNNSFWKLVCSDMEEEEEEEEDKDLADDFQQKVNGKGAIYVERRIGEDDMINERRNNLFRYEPKDHIMITFIEEINNLKIFSHTNELRKSNLTKYEFISGFTRNAWNFLHFQSLQMMDISAYLNETDISQDELFEVVIQEKTVATSRMLSVYEYVLSTTNAGPSVKESDLCEEELNYMTKSYGYLQIGYEISKISATSPFTSVDNVPPSSAFDFLLNYNNVETKNDCLKKLKAFRENFEPCSGIVKSHLINLTKYAFKYEQYHAGALYFRICNNETMIFQIFDSLIDEYGSLSKSIYEYFIIFINHLFKTRNLRLETLTDILVYSYTRLNVSSYFTFSSRQYYFTTIHLIIDDAVYNKTISAGTRLKLENILIDKNILIMEISELLFAKNTNWEKLKWLAEQLPRYDLPYMGHSIFKQMNETNIISKKAKDFFYTIRREKNLRSYLLFDWIIMDLFARNVNKTEVFKFAQFVYNNYGEVPCYHTECVKNIDSILPGHSKKYLDSKVCSLFDLKYFKKLHLFEDYFENQHDERNTSAVPETERYAGNFYNWVFEYVEKNDTFLMKSVKGNFYVSKGKRLGNSGDYKLTVANQENKPIEWKVELRRNSNKYTSTFTLRSVQSNTTDLYLTATAYNERSHGSGTVLLSKLKSAEYEEDLEVRGHAEIWAFNCI